MRAVVTALYQESEAGRDEERGAVVRRTAYGTCPSSQRMKNPVAGGGGTGVGE